MGQPFAITRSEKIKTWTQLSKSVGHTMRTSIDPRQHLADVPEPLRVLHGSTDWVNSWKKEVEGMHLRKLQQGQSHTLVREFFLGMSPEWAEGKTSAEIDEWAEANLAWLKERFGPERVAFVALHLDEQSPHLAAYVKPLKKDPKGRGNGWTLSDRVLGLGGSKEALSKLQDDYAAAMARFGLRRGIKGSKASHQKTSDWRKQMAKPLDQPVVKPRTPKQLANETPDAYGKRVADTMAQAIFDQMKPYQQQAKAQSKKLNQQTGELKGLRLTVERLQSLALTLAKLFEFLLGRSVNLDDPRQTAEALSEVKAVVNDVRRHRRRRDRMDATAASAPPGAKPPIRAATAANVQPGTPTITRLKL